MKSNTLADTEWLHSFVVKNGVLLGGLSQAQPRAALALAWAGLLAVEVLAMRRARHVAGQAA